MPLSHVAPISEEEYNRMATEGLKVYGDGSEWITKDSGQRQEWSTGARRDVQAGKGRYDLLSPFALRRVAGVYQRGAEKYGERNYEAGIPLTRYIDSALRHIEQYLQGEIDEDHAGQAAWNLLALLHTDEAIRRGILPPELDDRPDYSPKYKVAVQPGE